MSDPYNNYHSNLSNQCYYDYSRDPDCETVIADTGPDPLVLNIHQVTKNNNTFRTAAWTGSYLQLTIMSIPVGGEIGLEIHPDVDQFLKIEDGYGIILVGDSKDCLNQKSHIHNETAIIIPAGKWHNILNTGCKPLQLYSIYAPIQHPHGTVHCTKADSDAAEY